MLKFYYFSNFYIKQDFLIKYNIILKNIYKYFNFCLYFLIRNINKENNILFYKIRWIFSIFLKKFKIFISNFKFKVIQTENIFDFVCKIYLKKKTKYIFFLKLFFLYKMNIKQIIDMNIKKNNNYILFKINLLHLLSPLKEMLVSWELPLYIQWLKNKNKIVDLLFLYFFFL